MPHKSAGVETRTLGLALHLDKEYLFALEFTFEQAFFAMSWHVCSFCSGTC